MMAKHSIQEVSREEIATAAFYRSDRYGAVAYRERTICRLEENATGAWYLIRCELGRDLTAMRHLSRRRFGVFLPMQGMRRVFPGWICAYVFDIKVNEARLLDCPGVIGVLKCSKGIPVRPDLAFIRSLAATTWEGIAPPTGRKKADKQAKVRVVGRDRNKLAKLKRAAKRADRAGELSRAVDIRAQITALRQKHRPAAAA